MKGVIVGPSVWYLGFVGAPEQIKLSADHVWLEVRKFVRLAAAANPTMPRAALHRPADHRAVTDAGGACSRRASAS